jgi:hypothetical protein
MVPESVDVFTPCAEVTLAVPSKSKHHIIPANNKREAVDTHTHGVLCMRPPVVAPTDLPLPQAVAGCPANLHTHQMKQLNTRLLLQYSVAIN